MPFGKELMHWLSYLSGDGRWSVDAIHRSLIDAVLCDIDVRKAQVIREQLLKKYFVQWMSGGRINRLFFDHPDDLPRIEERSFADKLFKVELFIEGKKHMAHVTFYEGRIFSVELKVPRKLYKDKEYRIGAVTEGKAKDSFTAAIDRAAHGRATDINP